MPYSVSFRATDSLYRYLILLNISYTFYIYIYLFLRQFLQVYISQLSFLVRLGIKIGRSLLYDFYLEFEGGKKRRKILRILLDDGIEERRMEWRASRCGHECAMHPRILNGEGRRGTASMSRGHQTGQARIATMPGPVGDLQRVTRRESNEVRGQTRLGLRTDARLRPSITKLCVGAVSLAPPPPLPILEPSATNFCVHTMRKSVEEAVTQWDYQCLWEAPHILSHRINQ